MNESAGIASVMQFADHVGGTLNMRTAPGWIVIAGWTMAACAARADAPWPSVTFLPDLAPGFAAMPRLAADTPAALRINADLAAIDRAALTSIGDCRGREGSDWARWIVVGAAGPGYLSLTERHDFYCTGAAHPNRYHVDRTYDLTTGLPVEWPALLPARLAPVADAYARRSDAASYTSPALIRLYQDLTGPPSPDCEGFAEGLHFTFSLSAAERSLILTPVGYAYALTPCSDPALVPVRTLRAMGAAPALVAALDRGP